jgi:hypothetical protein
MPLCCSRGARLGKGLAKPAVADPLSPRGGSMFAGMVEGGRYQQGHSTRRPAGDEGVMSNSRLTGATAAVLLVLLAVEGLTVLRVRGLLSLHVFVGMLLIPPVLLKIGSTGWRVARYYMGFPAYRHKGPPPIVLRFLGPFVVALTVVLFGSGVALILAPHSLRHELLFVHKASFVLWFAAIGCGRCIGPAVRHSHQPGGRLPTGAGHAQPDHPLSA